MTYQIYKLTSPSGKFYIGLTKQGIKTRWDNHVRKALTQLAYNHGLYNAIRKYGAAAFTTEELAVAQSKQEAQRLEKKFIAGSDKSKLYNISPGGEADGETGGKIFWDRMRNDPAAMEAYVKKLSDAKRANDTSDYTYMQECLQKWRRENRKVAYQLARRGTRIMNRRVPAPPSDERTLKDKLMWKWKKGEVVRKNTTAFWEHCSDEKRAEHSAKVSAAATAQWDAIKDPQIRSAMTSKARAAIDRKTQGAAASRGVKKFWEDLKKDPARYSEYMVSRTASLMKTIERKK